ncbi:MAG: prepilin-type N-terminal cleavage/methylation domain-containing protein [Nitrospinae bacterium]|nr:prepilin-type N-terminal cleavage/methylation domain-containing protein [Nitrospinota bacterium]
MTQRASFAKGQNTRAGGTGNAGFTLIEILIAVLIVGIIFSFIFTVLTSGVSASKDATHKMEVERIGRYFIQRITTDLTCLTLLPISKSGGLVGKHTLVNGKSRDEIHFTSFTESYFTGRPTFDQAEVGYFFITLEGGKDVLMRRESDIVEKPVTQGGVAYAITDMVDDLSIKYFSGGEWINSWDTTAGPALPPVISVQLTLLDGSRKYLFTTIVKIMI